MRSLVPSTLALLAATAVPATPAAAQELRLGVSQGWSDHRLLGDPVGAEVQLRPTGALRHVRLVYAEQRASERYTGHACWGFVRPDEPCPLEPMRRRGSLRSYGVVVPVTALRRDRVELQLLPDVRLTRVAGDERGLATRNSFEDSRHMLWLGGGAALAVQPLSRLPARLQLGVHVAAITAPESVVLDAYNPFGEGLTMRRVELALSWAFRDGTR